MRAVMRLARRLVLSIVAAGAALAAAAAVQDPRPQVFGVDVRLVAIPVFVTDKSGHAVSDLGIADFEVEDQGRKVAITGFLLVDASAPTGEAPPAASPALAAASRRQLLLLFDRSFSGSAQIVKAREAALKMLADGVQPGDLVAVASLGPAGLRILTGFTPDRAQTAQALATFGSAEGQRLRDPLGLAYDLGATVLANIPAYGLQVPEGDLDERGRVLQLGRAERDHYRRLVAGYLDELQALGKLLDSVQGRKQVVLLSAGFDQSVLTGAAGTEQAENASSVATGRLWEVQSDRHFGDAGSRAGLDRLYEALARSDTVVHTIDVSGPSALSMTERAAGIAQGAGRETLAQIAGRSGGRFVPQSGDLASALREVLTATRHFYVLAFEPADTGKKAGEPRKIKVKVNRPGLAVSHRASYTLPAAAPAVQERQLSAAEVIAKGLSGGALRLSALAVPYRGEDGSVRLPVVLEIDGGSLLAGTSGATLPLELYAYAFDGQGRVMDALGLTPTLDLKAVGTLLESKGLQVLTSFRVEPGPVDLRFLVRDTSSGRGGSLRVTTSVPAFGDDARVLSPPLLMDDPRARVVIPAASRANPRLEIPFRLQDAAFTPKAAALLRNGEAQEVCVMAFGLAAGAEIRVQAELVGQDGRVLALESGAARAVPDHDRFQRLVVAVTPRSIPPGDYRLRLGVPGLGASEIPVRVR